MDSGFITQMKDKNGDMWYHQVVIDTINENKDKMYQKLLLYSNELEDRISKAIEYIEKNQEKQYAMSYEYGLSYNELPKLLDILKGVDKE